MRMLKSLFALLLIGMLSSGLSPNAAQAHPKRVVKVLPRGHVVVHAGKVRYHYHAGVFYRPVRGGFVVVRAPVGAIVPVLPVGYRVVHVHGRVYYCHNGVYYRPIWHRGRRAYLVVDLHLDL
ncbi:DUF6515 family protein [Rhodothermus marinus]|nr:DUF6515 family protein [Rhodothermus marinus]AEN74362.1 hypothetical protein Rhom172_2469 [Rhodothermus marinus SG0.5JP17-172]MBO2492442.1 hypothetical protein [Rhodothermus marinus]BBM70789.1 hypothetical protein RmaAA213_26350 [Rhodothermus marinus]